MCVSKLKTLYVAGGKESALVQWAYLAAGRSGNAMLPNVFQSQPITIIRSVAYYCTTS